MVMLLGDTGRNYGPHCNSVYMQPLGLIDCLAADIMTSKCNLHILMWHVLELCQTRHLLEGRAALCRHSVSKVLIHYLTLYMPMKVSLEADQPQMQGS